jgi:hypothetical protein
VPFFTHTTNYLSHILASKTVTTASEGLQVDLLLTYPATNYLNPGTIIDIFYSPTTNVFLIPTVQGCVDTATTGFFKHLWYYSDNLGSLVRLNADLVLGCDLLSPLFVPGSQFLHVNSSIVSELNFLNSPKTDADTLIGIALSSRSAVVTDAFEIFEVCSINVDNTLYMNLHTPIKKLVYPEPYIASPNFVHEEFFFIHILHFQHWLWFFFISLIMFFFITFINVVR